MALFWLRWRRRFVHVRTKNGRHWFCHGFEIVSRTRWCSIRTNWSEVTRWETSVVWIVNRVSRILSSFSFIQSGSASRARLFASARNHDWNSQRVANRLRSPELGNSQRIFTRRSIQWGGDYKSRFGYTSRYDERPTRFIRPISRAYYVSVERRARANRRVFRSVVKRWRSERWRKIYKLAAKSGVR